MRRTIFLFALCMLVTSTYGKTTYIPAYRSYIHIVNVADTISAASSVLGDMELSEENGMFTISIEHEDVTKDKVKAIKRAKRTAGWAIASAVLSGVSAAFSNNSLQYLVRSTNAQIASQLAGFYSATANNEQKLKIDMWIHNTSNEELMVNDLERGLLWYILPQHSLHITMNNPDAANLRISNIENNTIRYVAAMAGSMLNKWEVGWEDDNSWIVAVYKKQVIEYEQYESLDKYRRISKTDYSETDMSIEEFRAFIKERKNEKKKNN